MNQPADVYVFVSGDPHVKGLTLDRSGRNLPPPQDHSAWLPAAVTRLAVADLRRHALDPESAYRNLHTRGFHVAPLIAQVQYPQAHWLRKSNGVPADQDHEP